MWLPLLAICAPLLPGLYLAIVTAAYESKEVFATILAYGPVLISAGSLTHRLHPASKLGTGLALAGSNFLSGSLLSLLPLWRYRIDWLSFEAPYALACLLFIISVNVLVLDELERDFHRARVWGNLKNDRAGRENS